MNALGGLVDRRLARGPELVARQTDLASPPAAAERAQFPEKPSAAPAESAGGTARGP